MREATGGYENPSLTTFEFRASCAHQWVAPSYRHKIVDGKSLTCDGCDDDIYIDIYIYIGCGPLRVTVANEGL